MNDVFYSRRRSVVAGMALTCALLQTPGAWADDISIGVLANLTGPETTSSVDMVRGVELALEELNKSGGVNGQKLVAITEDAEYRPQAGVDAAHKLIDVNKVPVILNIGGSGIMLPVGEYAASQGVVLINTGASSPQLRNVKTLCSVVPLDDIVGKVLGEWAFEKGYKKAVTVVPDNPYGIGVQDASAKGFTAAGGEVTDKITYTEGQADYRPEVQRIMATTPDAVLSATYGDDANLLLKQAYDAGQRVPWFVTYPTILTVKSPETANKLLFGLEVGWELPEAQEFMSKTYAAKYGSSPTTPWANYSYDGMMLVGLAMRQCGATSECVRSKIKDVAATYAGVTGKIELDNECQRTNAPLVKLEYQDGKLRAQK